MDPNEILNKAFRASCAQVVPSAATDRPSREAAVYMKLLKVCSQQCAQEVAPRIRPDDKAGLMVVIQMPLDNGKWEDGVFIGMKDRAILGWSTGTFRVKRFAIEIPYDQVMDVKEVDRRAASSTQREAVTLEIQLRNGAQLIRTRSPDEGADIDFLVSGALTGGITYN